MREPFRPNMPWPAVERSWSIEADVEQPFVADRQSSLFKSEAQLSLEQHLQGNHHVGTSAHARSSLVPDTQPRDAKPRLLLMGLRR